MIKKTIHYPVQVGCIVICITTKIEFHNYYHKVDNNNILIILKSQIIKLKIILVYSNVNVFIVPDDILKDSNDKESKDKESIKGICL